MTTATPAQSRGRAAEDCALSYLQARGLRLLERNYRCRYGEVDLIMEEGDILVFVEVRYRASQRYGGALESVNPRKRIKLQIAASCFLKERRCDQRARFDVAALSPAPEGMKVQWVRDAFRAD